MRSGDSPRKVARTESSTATPSGSRSLDEASAFLAAATGQGSGDVKVVVVGNLPVQRSTDGSTIERVLVGPSDVCAALAHLGAVDRCVVLDKPRMRGKAIVDIVPAGASLDACVAAGEVVVPVDVVVGVLPKGHRLAIEWKTAAARPVPPPAPHAAAPSTTGQGSGGSGHTTTASAVAGSASSTSDAAARPGPSAPVVAHVSGTKTFYVAGSPKRLRSFHDVFQFFRQENCLFGVASTIVYVESSRRPYFLMDVDGLGTAGRETLEAQMLATNGKLYQGEAVSVSLSRQSCAEYLAKKPDALVSRAKTRGELDSERETAKVESQRALAVSAFVPRAVAARAGNPPSS